MIFLKAKKTKKRNVNYSTNVDTTNKIYVTAQSAPTAGAAESADNP
jgi:hypothetical protein